MTKEYLDPVYRIVIERASPSNNTLREMPFYEYRKLRKLWKTEIALSLKGQIPPAPIEKAGLVIIRHSSGLLDWDNALGGLKPILDCLVRPSLKNPDGLGLITDDNPKGMIEPPYMEQRSAAKKAGKTEILVYDLTINNIWPPLKITG